MKKKSEFGALFAASLNIGDIVKWSKWDTSEDSWAACYGVVISVKNEIRMNRMVSISRVIPLLPPTTELEFFTISLKLISPSKPPIVLH
tara:strand:+ start:7664 stop:7930 length:267 start_codon:yes stop_codon:yes gene_type:complete